MMKDEFSSRFQGNAHRGVSPKSDDSNSPFSSQLFIVVFGGDVQRTEGVPAVYLPLLTSNLRRVSTISLAGFHLTALRTMDIPEIARFYLQPPPSL